MMKSIVTNVLLRSFYHIGVICRISLARVYLKLVLALQLEYGTETRHQKSKASNSLYRNYDEQEVINLKFSSSRECLIST